MGLIALVGMVKGKETVEFDALILFWAPKVIAQATAVLVGVLVAVFVELFVGEGVVVFVPVLVDVKV